MEDNNHDLNHEAFIQKMQLQYFDTQEDTKSDDWNFIPIRVTAHRVSITPQRKIMN